MSAFSARAQGLDWHFSSWGNEKAARRVVFLHGFTGAAIAWEGVASAIARAQGAFCLAPDLPGHGSSSPPLPVEDWSLERAADALAELIEPPFDLVGYSLGGRLALHLACRHPGLVERLALIGAAVGLRDDDARRSRRLADRRWLRLLEDESIEAFVTAWEAQPIFATEARLPAEVRQAAHQRRLEQNPAGLAANLAAFGLGTQADLREAIAAFPGFIHWIAGEEDSKFQALAREMAHHSGQSALTLVPGAGHNVLLERPEFLGDALQRFLFPLAKEHSR